jgi:hypothetical protein
VEGIEARYWDSRTVWPEALGYWPLSMEIITIPGDDSASRGHRHARQQSLKDIVLQRAYDKSIVVQGRSAAPSNRISRQGYIHK